MSAFSLHWACQRSVRPGGERRGSFKIPWLLIGAVSGLLSKSHFLRRPLPQLSLQWWLLLHCCLTHLPADEMEAYSLAPSIGLSSGLPAPAGASCPRAHSPPGTSVCCLGAFFSVSVNISWDILCFLQESRVCSQRGLPAGSGTTASGVLLSPGRRRKKSIHGDALWLPCSLLIQTLVVKWEGLWKCWVFCPFGGHLTAFEVLVWQKWACLLSVFRVQPGGFFTLI